MFSLSEEECSAQCELGMSLLEAGLSMAEGEVLDTSAWMAQNAPTDERKRMALHAMTFLIGVLGVFAMEFTHKEVGEVPISEVRAVLEDEKHRTYKGFELTKETVCVQYRRIQLERSGSTV
jgi:hypothetical protein